MSTASDLYISTPLEEGIILRRPHVGELSTNVPHLLRHHSPTGFEWGYGGSGPADLALNIVENILIKADFKGQRGESAWDKYRPFRASWYIYQEFKREFVARIPQSPGEYTINYEQARRWVMGALERAPEFYTTSTPDDPDDISPIQ